MAIREQDKTIIHYIALLGAFLSALFVWTLLWNLSNSDRTAILKQNEILVQNDAMDRIRQLSNISEKGDLPEKIAPTVSLPSLTEDAPAISPWSQLYGWQLTAIALIGAILGGATGYGLMWLGMYSGSVVLYALIRKMYRILRLTSPHFAEMNNPTVLIGSHLAVQRDSNRILPILTKIFVLLTMALLLLGIVVWQITSFR